mmetsp:Transcript_118254/g.341859  ORF Transcript_118254/g.341859 Transcript_118254/m.341859 type:complete len:277 (+) Transcript_118254:696-1526(+)
MQVAHGVLPQCVGERGLVTRVLWQSRDLQLDMGCHRVQHQNADEEDEDEDEIRGPEQGRSHTADVLHELSHRRGVPQGAKGLRRLDCPRHPQDPHEGEPDALCSDLDDCEEEHEAIEDVPVPVPPQEVGAPIGDKIDRDLNEHPNDDEPLDGHQRFLPRMRLRRLAIQDLIERRRRGPIHVKGYEEAVSRRHEQAELVEPEAARQPSPPRVHHGLAQSVGEASLCGRRADHHVHRLVRELGVLRRCVVGRVVLTRDVPELREPQDLRRGHLRWGQA